MKMLIDAIRKTSAGPALQDNPSEIRNTYLFDDDFMGFSGHFPGYPILPAVLQLLVARLLIEEKKGYEIRVTSIGKAKFMSEIRPNDPITVQCVDADTEESRRCKVKIISGDRTVSSFNMYFCPLKEDADC